MDLFSFDLPAVKSVSRSTPPSNESNSLSLSVLGMLNAACLCVVHCKVSWVRKYEYRNLRDSLRSPDHLSTFSHDFARRGCLFHPTVDKERSLVVIRPDERTSSSGVNRKWRKTQSEKSVAIQLAMNVSRNRKPMVRLVSPHISIHTRTTPWVYLCRYILKTHVSGPGPKKSLDSGE